MTIVRFSGLELRFKQDKHATNGRLDLFEMTVEPKAKMPVAHYHDAWDETIYGLSGVTTWRVDGKDHSIGAGDSVFIAKGVVHGFRNDSEAPSSCLVILTPGALGPDYFQEMAALVAAGAPDPEKMKGVMQRYGLIPAPGN